MKIRIFAILGIVGAICFSSCNLDQYPYSEFASDEYVTDDNSVNDLVMGCYNGLHDVMYYEWAMTELRSDNARMFNNNSTSNTTKLSSIQSTSGWRDTGKHATRSSQEPITCWPMCRW